MDCKTKVRVSVVEVASSLEVNSFEADSFGDVEESVVVGHVSSLCSGAAVAPVVSTAINVIAVMIAMMIVV